MANTDSDKEGFLFTVELLIEDRAVGLALEKLIRLLNTEHVKDYRVLKGMDVGKIIYETIKQNSNKGSVKPSDLPGLKNGKFVPVQPKQIQPTQAQTARVQPPQAQSAEAQPKQVQPVQEQSAQAKKSAVTSKNNKEIMKQMEELRAKGTLLRISIIKGNGVKLNMPCRVLNIDAAAENITLYNVDEKQVYLVALNEIDDFTVN